MPTGSIKSYDLDDQRGTIAADDGDATYNFELSDIADRHTGEQPTAGERVSFEEDGDRATNVRREAHRGYD